jgi:hypothetical protein
MRPTGSGKKAPTPVLVRGPSPLVLPLHLLHFFLRVPASLNLDLRSGIQEMSRFNFLLLYRISISGRRFVHASSYLNLVVFFSAFRASAVKSLFNSRRFLAILAFWQFLTSHLLTADGLQPQNGKTRPQAGCVFTKHQKPITKYSRGRPRIKYETPTLAPFLSIATKNLRPSA